MITRCLVFVGISILGAANAAAQYAGVLFDDSHVHDIYIQMKPADWDALRENYLLDTKYDASFRWHDSVFEQVSVRSRGSASRNPVKPNLRVDFDDTIKNQTFHGLPRLVLDNGSQDKSLIKERLSMKVFERMGIPAPREVPAKLFINNEFAGSYVVVEPINEQFLLRTLGENSGQLYEYNAVDPYYFQYLGGDVDLYTPERFEPKKDEDSLPPSDLIMFIQTLNDTPDSEFIGRMSQLLDMQHFVRHIAVEQYLAEVDGINGWNGVNNFYLYESLAPKLFRFLPWDKDLTFHDKELSIQYNMEQNVLTRRILEHPELQQAYFDALREVAEICGGPDGWLERELDFAYQQIRQDARVDPLLQCVSADNTVRACGPDEGPFEEEIRRMREFIRERQAKVLAELEILEQTN